MSRRLFLQHVLSLSGGAAEVCRQDREGKPVTRFKTAGRTDYDFRVPILFPPYAEVIFDIDHKPPPPSVLTPEESWRLVRRDAIHLSETLTREGVDHHNALSGGHGFHISVLLYDPSSQPGGPSRGEFVRYIVGKASEGFDPFSDEPPLGVDPVGYAKNGQVFREYGSVKRWAKVPWRRPIRELPETREEAYKIAGRQPPPARMPAPHTHRSDMHRALVDALGRGCPRPGATVMFDGLCEDVPCQGCPLVR